MAQQMGGLQPLTIEEWAASEGYKYPWPSTYDIPMQALYQNYIRNWQAAQYGQTTTPPDTTTGAELGVDPRYGPEISGGDIGTPTGQFPTQQIGAVPPEEAFGYGTGMEFADWIRRLKAGGMEGYSPAQRWARNQYQPSMLNYELANQLRLLQGTPQTAWSQAPLRSALDPNLWGQVQGLQGQAGQDWIGQMGGSEGYPLWNMAAASLGGGRITPGTQWLQQQAGPQYWNWSAYGDPGVQGTTGVNWTDWIKQYMQPMGI